MKNQTPNTLALYVALLVSFLTTAPVVFISLFLYEKFNWLLPVTLSLISFLVTYFLFRYTVNKFIYEKIKLVYKTIHQLKLGQKKALKKKIETGDDIISDVNNEVISWAKDKKEEIDELKKMEEYRREFIGNLAHELKTPVFNVQGYISTLIDDEADEMLRKKYLENARRILNV